MRARNPVVLEEGLAGEMGRTSPRLAGTDVDRGLAQINWHQLRMQVGHMQQSDVAVVIEREQRILGHALLRGGAADRSKPQRRRCGANSAARPDG